MHRLCYCKIIIILLFNVSIFAQNRGGIIDGAIIDSKTKAGIEFANITIHNSKDSAIITGSVSGKGGEFIIANIPEGKFYAKITLIGYNKKIIPNIVFRKDQKELSLGKIKLDESVILLNESEVIGKRQDMEFHNDKKVINVKQDISSVGHTALEVLKNQPSVQSDASGDITLRGSSNFTVLVDGKPSPLQGSDALRQIPSNIIDNIELITNPSAKYDAEGAVGIINIVTKKNIESFLSGAANIGTGTDSRKNGDINLSYKDNGYTLNAGIDYRNQPFNSNQNIDREIFNNSESVFLHNSGEYKSKREISNLRLGIEYNFDNLNNASINSSIGKMKINFNNDDKIHDFHSSTDIYSYIHHTLLVTPKYNTTALNLSHKFVPNVSEITAEALYSYAKVPNAQSSNDYFSDYTFTSRSPQPIEQTINDNSSTDRYRFKVNYTQKSNGKIIFESGVQANIFYKNSDVRNNIFDWDENIWETTIESTNKMNLRNNVYAGFAQYSDMLFNCEYQIGFRAELTDRILDQLTLNQKYVYNKLDFFPSLSFSKKFGEINNLQFSYSRRINRPNDIMLNPYKMYQDTYSSWSGNPDLKPETIDSYEINFQTTPAGLFFSIQTYLRSMNNSFYQTTTVENNQRLHIMIGNYGNTTNSGVELSCNLSLPGVFQISPSVNLFNSRQSNKVNEIETKRDLFSWSTRLNLSSNLSETTPVQISINYTGKRYNQQIETKPQWTFSGGIRQSLFDKRLTISLQAQNLIKMTYENINRNQEFIEYSKANLEKNILTFSLSYNFNNFLKPKNIPDVEINTN
jgi:outer membrane receptor protein involved in Fe transport